MDNFDELSNDQLRQKMLELGMPNMPITTTTRKLVVKKLKNYVENANSKTRRDTIHVTKFSSDEDTDAAEEPKKPQKKEPSRRITIGGSASKLSKTLPVLPDLPPPKPAAEKRDAANKRRSGRITPVLSKDDAPKVSAPKEPMIVEDSADEDEEMLPLTQVVNRRDRKSASPSLSRAEMVSTSYVHQVEITAKPTILEEMEIDLTESTDNVVVEPEPEPIPERRPRPPLTPSRESRYSTNITSASTSSKRATIGSGFSFATTPSRQSDQLSSSFGRPSIAATYTPREARREEVQLEPTDSPYLSEFTKRLSRLKAENAQLNSARDHPIRRTMAPTYTSARPTDGDYVSSRLVTVRGQRPDGPVRKEGEIRAHLRQVILSLDQKYPIKKMFYLLIVAMIVIFLFVFFFL